MTLLRPAPATTDRHDESVPFSSRLRALGLALAAGVLAVLVSWLVMALPVVVAWFFDARSTVTLTEALGISLDIWALAHRAGIDVAGVNVVFAPLLLTLIPLLACRYAIGQVLIDRADRGVKGKVKGAGAAWRALGGNELTVFVLGYLGLGVTLCYLAGLGQAPVHIASALPGLLLVPVIAIAWGLAKEHRTQANPVIARGLEWVEAHTPVLVRRGLRPGLESLCLLLVMGVVIVGVTVGLQTDRILTLYGALDAGVVGTSVLTMAQLAALPNMVVWATAWSGGATVQVGTAQIGWAESTTGDLPLIPVLAALPEPGPLPPMMWISAAIPVLVGVWMGWRVAAAAPRLATWWTKAQAGLAAAIGLTIAMLALAWLASGGMTPGRLGLVGVQAWITAALLGAQVLASSMLTMTLLHLTRRRM